MGVTVSSKDYRCLAFRILSCQIKTNCWPGPVSLQIYPVAPDKTGPQTIEILTKRITAVGALQTGSFCVDCDTTICQSPMSQQKILHVIHNSEQPASVFGVLETGTKHICVVADYIFQVLLMKITGTLSGGAKPKADSNTKIESRGQRFEAGDFIVKLGMVTMGTNFKGIIVEVEYQPCWLPKACYNLMKEFIQSFMGSCVPNNPPPYLQNRLMELYHPRDTALQYLEAFQALRKAVR